MILKYETIPFIPMSGKTQHVENTTNYKKITSQ